MGSDPTVKSNIEPSVESNIEPTIEPNYIFLFSEKEACERLKDVVRGYPYLDFTLDEGVMLYNNESETKDTYVLVYKRPLAYGLVEFFSLLAKKTKRLDRFFRKKLDEMLADFLSSKFSHEMLHQTLDEFVGYNPSTRSEQKNMEFALDLFENEILDKFFGHPEYYIDCE